MRKLSKPSTAQCNQTLYTFFLLAEPKYVSCVRLTEILSEVSHDSVNRFLLRERYTPEDLFTGNRPNDQLDALLTVDAIDPRLGQPKRAALDNGYFSGYFNITHIEGLQSRGIEPYIATGRQSHHLTWKTWLKELRDPPAPEATPKLKMADKLKPDEGQALYRLRKGTVEPVIGIIKETIGFRQFSLRGLPNVQGEWSLVCLAFNLKRLHRLIEANSVSPTG